MKKRKISVQNIILISLICTFFIVIIYGLLSPNICDRILVPSGILFVVWLFFNSPLVVEISHKTGWRFFMPLSIVLLLLWIFLRLSQYCAA